MINYHSSMYQRIPMEFRRSLINRIKVGRFKGERVGYTDKHKKVIKNL